MKDFSDVVELPRPHGLPPDGGGGRGKAGVCLNSLLTKYFSVAFFGGSGALAELVTTGFKIGGDGVDSFAEASCLKSRLNSALELYLDLTSFPLSSLCTSSEGVASSVGVTSCSP